MTPRDQAPFVIDLAACLRGNEITQEWRPAPRPTNSTIEQAITRTWNALATREGIELFNGDLARLVRAETSLSTLHLALGPTCYRDFVGTNVDNADLVLGENAQALANALGTSAVVVTADGYLALGRRSERVANHAGYLHCFGGMLEAADRREGDRFDIPGAILRELHEEIGLIPSEIETTHVIGLARDRRLHQPELIFETPAALTRSELSARHRDAPEASEHTGVEFALDDPEAIPAFLDSALLVTPIAQASLLLHGRNRWGAEWFQQTYDGLYGR